jgi:hypothetical protein
MNVCHDENAVLTPDGCVQIEDLTGTEIILDAWDCAADGNMVCGSPLSVEIGTALVIERQPREALPRTGIEGTLASIAVVLILLGMYLVVISGVGTYLKRRDS